MATKKELIFEFYLDSSFAVLARCDSTKVLEPAPSGSHPVWAAGGWTSWHNCCPQGVMLQGMVAWTKSGTMRQLHYFRMQYQRLWRWWSLAEDVVLGEGAVAGPQSVLSKYSGCC